MREKIVNILTDIHETTYENEGEQGSINSNLDRNFCSVTSTDDDI